MAQDITLTIDGLHTNPSDLSEVPKGALKVAKNVDIDRPSVATPRKGFDRFGGEFSNTDARAGSVFFFDDKVLVRRDDDVLQYWDGAAWQAYSGTVAGPETGTPVRAVPGGKSLFLTTAAGIKKLSSATGTLNPAGLRAPAFRVSNDASNNGVAVSNSSRVAFRFTVVKTDEHGVPYESAPSARLVLTKPITDNNYTYIPEVYVYANNPGPATLRVYASEEQDISVVPSDASDEMQLVREIPYTSTAECPTITLYPSNYLQERRGAALYTNSTQQGIVAANERPPIAKDLTVFNGFTFYLAPKFRQRLLLAVKDTQFGCELYAGDTLTIGSMVITLADAFSASSSLTARTARCSAISVDPDLTTPANTTTDAINTGSGNPFQNGDQIVFVGTGLPSPLTANRLYYVRDRASTSFKVSETYGGSAVNITTAGTPNFYMLLHAAEGIEPSDESGLFVGNRDTQFNTQQLVLALNQPGPGNTPSPYRATYLSGYDDVPGQMLIEATDPDAPAFTVSYSSINGPSTDAWVQDLTNGNTVTSSDDYAPNKLAWSKQFQPDSVPLTNVHPGIGSARAEALRILPTRDSLFILKEDGVYRLTGATAETFSVEDFDTSVQVIAPKAACVLDNMIFCLTSEGPAIVSDLGVEKRFGDPILKELMDLRGRTSAKVAHFDANTWAVAHDKRWILSVGYLDADSNAQTKLYVFNIRTKTWTSWEKDLTCAESSPFDGNLYAGSADYAYLLVQNRETYDDADSGTDTAFESEIEWVVKTFGNPAALNQYSGIQVVMLDDFPTSGELVTSTDTNPTTISQTLTAHPVGSRRPHRKGVPRNHQRASTLSVKVKHSGAGYYEIAGIAIEGTRTSTRTQK